jgi:hypothetical protein
MLSRNKIFLIIPVLALAISCTKASNDVPPPTCGQPEPDTCVYSGPAIGLVSISGPSVANVGQPVQFNVIVTGSNGCAASAEVSGAAVGNNITITGNVHYIGCMCTQALADVNSTYSFTPTQPGVYLLQGETYEGSPVTHTLTVQ